MKYFLSILLLFNVLSIFSMSHDDKLQYIQGLLATGDDINQPRQELCHRTPLEYAAENDTTHDLLVRLLDHGAIIEDHQLDDPAYEGAVQNFRTLLETSKKRKLNIAAILNHQDPDNEFDAATPFLSACQYDTFNTMIEDMVAHGATLKPDTPSQETCLHRATLEFATKNVATLLPIIQETCPHLIDAQDSDKNTALHYACGYEIGEPSYPIAQLLCSYKANPNVENSQCVTPFMTAIHTLQEIAYPSSQRDLTSEPYIEKLTEILLAIKVLLMHGAETAYAPAWHDSLLLTGLRTTYNEVCMQKERLPTLRHDSNSHIHALPLELIGMLQDIIHARIMFDDDPKIDKKRKKPTT